MVKLRLANGRELTLQTTQLSKEDQDFLVNMSKTAQASDKKGLPQQTRIELPVKAEGGPFEFKTEHYVFVSESKTNESFISEAAEVFEGTYQAIDSLPMGLHLVPPGGDVIFRARLMTSESFLEEVVNYIDESPDLKAVPVYLEKRKKLWVPYESFGAVRKGGQMIMDPAADKSALIHEITHHMMHSWLVVTPRWFTEGMAEYIASVPYQKGTFDFKNSAQGLKNRLENKYKGMPTKMIYPDDLFDANDLETWKGGLDDHLSAMLWVHYFVNLDHDGSGEVLMAYLKRMGRSPDDIIKDYNEFVNAFTKKREEYNKKVDEYNLAGKTFEVTQNEYNVRIKKYNQQVADGVAEGDRIEVGKKPELPPKPEKFKVPEILSIKLSDDEDDVFLIANALAKSALMNERDAEELKEDVTSAFAEIGIPVSFADPRTKGQE